MTNIPVAMIAVDEFETACAFTSELLAFPSYMIGWIIDMGASWDALSAASARNGSLWVLKTSWQCARNNRAASTPPPFHNVASERFQRGYARRIARTTPSRPLLRPLRTAASPALKERWGGGAEPASSNWELPHAAGVGELSHRGKSQLRAARDVAILRRDPPISKVRAPQWPQTDLPRQISFGAPSTAARPAKTSNFPDPPPLSIPGRNSGASKAKSLVE